MTDKQRIKSILADIEEYSFIDISNICDSGYQGAMIIKDALKRQLPKKVEKVYMRKTEWGSPWRCPDCGADQNKVEFVGYGPNKEKTSYCWSCGQKLDWND